MDIGSVGAAGRRIYGVVIGIVVDNKHPDGEYRVKLKFPWIRSTDSKDDEDFTSSWARITTQMAGLGRGLWLLPEVDDEVLVVFEHGDVRRPIVIGSLWNGVDLPPVGDKAAADPKAPSGLTAPDHKSAAKDNKEQEGKNNLRFFHSRSGHVLVFNDDDKGKKEKVYVKTKHGHTIVLDDTDGKENIALYDSTGEEYVLIDEKNKKITIETVKGDIDILCKKGKLNIEANEITTNAEKTATHEAKNKMTHKSKEVDINGSSEVVVKGDKIKLN